MADGTFAAEIVPVAVQAGKGDPVMVAEDEEPKKVIFEKIGKLKPAFEKDGTITAANASKINDGAAAVVVMAAEKAAALGLKPQARIVAQASFAHAPADFPTAPAGAIRKALAKAGLSAADIDLWEINEAFAAGGPGGHPGAGPGPGQGQRPRRRGGAGPPHRRQRRAADRHAAERHAEAERPVRAGVAVHRRRRGLGHDRRAN